MFDLLVRGGVVVTPAGCERRDVGVEDGLIAAVETDLAGDARETVDARGLHVFPGVVDAHVHCNDPGRADWEGFAHATRALAAGGATAFVDMPLNASPPTLDGASFDLKVAAATGTAHVDFALWGGLVPGELDRLDELAGRGVVGFKAFMCPSGIDDFPAVDDDALHAGMARAARLGLPVAVHAESAATTSASRREPSRRGARRCGTSSPRARSRPSSRRSSARPPWPWRRAAHSTSSTSRPAAASGSWPPPAPRGGRHVRDLPPLPRTRRGGRRGDRAAREVRAAAALTRRARGPLGRPPARPGRPRRLGSLTQPACAQAGRRRLRRLGRDRRVPDAAPGDADRGPRTRAPPRDDCGAVRRSPGATVRPRRQGLALFRCRRGPRPGRSRPRGRN